MSEVVTVTQAEEAAKEEAGNAAITADQFEPAAPLTAAPPAYDAETSYDKGALVLEGGQAYRSLEDENEGHAPSEDEELDHWVPVSYSVVVLQNPTLDHTPGILKQQAHNNKPPARSDAAAAPSETVGVGAETSV